ncbi:phosphatase domain-containing protein [Bdellovibrio sp. HCB117]|uniref:phosphatase domain-containing protein n=1 Tax=Bdellovibrio sp. HCB117 TaxID=3394359 RepID=UPI0039B5AC38
MKNFIAFLIFFVSLSSQAQTLFVSDVDDTIKLANVKDLSEAARYAFDDKSRFLGMNALYHHIVKENSDIRVVYLSKAPEWFMGRTHRNFLKNGNYPAGTYIGKTEYDSDVHKITNLRKLMEEHRPRKVILIGDNGEQDADIYAQLAQEYANQGIEFHQFIRIVYNRNPFIEWGAALHNGQTGFVTPLEISFELEKAHILSYSAVETLVKTLVPDFVYASSYAAEGDVAFPYFVNCQTFVWKWDDSLQRFDTMKQLKLKLTDRCRLKM